MTGKMLRTVIAGLVAAAAWSDVANAAFTLSVDPLGSMNFGTVVLASTATTTITQTTGGSISVTAPAFRPPSGVTTVTIPVTVKCLDAGGSGCKNAAHTITITGVRIGGRQLTVSSFNITTPTNSGGVTISTPNVGNPLSFTVSSPSNGPQTWTTTFNVGMTVAVSPASASAVASQWTITVKAT